MSQLDLACEAEVSARHLSFLETGRASPSRAMVLRLAEHLGVPLRERNSLLAAAGFAPAYPERALNDAALRPAREGVARLLTAHEPYPALAVDRHWTLVAANRAVAPLLAGASAALLQEPVNVLRLSLHPEGLTPRILNRREWRDHVLVRLRGQVAASGDPVLSDLLTELAGYPAGPPVRGAEAGVAMPLRLATESGTLAFLTTTMIFGTPVDVTLSELAVETFLPADAATEAALRRMFERP